MKIELIFIAAAVFFGTLLLWVSSGHSQSSMCATRAEMIRGLQGSNYKEVAIGKGIAVNGTIIIELFVGKETFTLLASLLGGERSCIIAAGKTWVKYPPESEGAPL